MLPFLLSLATHGSSQSLKQQGFPNLKLKIYSGYHSIRYKAFSFKAEGSYAEGKSRVYFT
jgi:hypothetical protein